MAPAVIITKWRASEGLIVESIDCHPDQSLWLDVVASELFPLTSALTPKASYVNAEGVANFSPGLEHSDNPGLWLANAFGVPRSISNGD